MNTIKIHVKNREVVEVEGIPEGTQVMFLNYDIPDPLPKGQKITQTNKGNAVISIYEKPRKTTEK